MLFVIIFLCRYYVGCFDSIVTFLDPILLSLFSFILRKKKPNNLPTLSIGIFDFPKNPTKFTTDRPTDSFFRRFLTRTEHIFDSRLMYNNFVV